MRPVKSLFYKGLRTLLCAGILSNVVSSAVATPAPLSQTGGFVIRAAWARTSHGENSAAYMIIKNETSHADQLMSASCDVCDKVELHRTELETKTQVYKMRPVSALEIPAYGEHVLEPGADHIMLMGLKRPLIEGESLSLKLIFKSAPPQTLILLVKGTSGHKASEKTGSNTCDCS